VLVVLLAAQVYVLLAGTGQLVYKRQEMEVVDGKVQSAAKAAQEVVPGRYTSPRHPARCEPSCFESNGILRRGGPGTYALPRHPIRFEPSFLQSNGILGRGQECLLRPCEEGVGPGTLLGLLDFWLLFLALMLSLGAGVGRCRLTPS